MKKITLLRCVLGILILLNLWMICGFSSQSAEDSGKTSEKVIRPVAQVIVKDFESKPQQEQENIISSLQLPVRKLAHMTEFGMLGILILLLLRTWKLPLLHCGLWSMLAVLICASADELHQFLAKEGRAGRVTDVLIDCAGALIGCLAVSGIWMLVKYIQKRKQKSA